MASGFTITAMKDVQRAHAKIDRLAQNKMQAALNKSLRAATKDTRKALKQAPVDALPKRGGLNKWAARTPTVRIHIRGREQGVHIKMTKRGHDLRALNRGRARHPVFGNRKVWVTQTVQSGWWDAATNKEGPRIVNEVMDTLSAAIEKEWRTP